MAERKESSKFNTGSSGLGSLFPRNEPKTTPRGGFAAVKPAPGHMERANRDSDVVPRDGNVIPLFDGDAALDVVRREAARNAHGAMERRKKRHSDRVNGPPSQSIRQVAADIAEEEKAAKENAEFQEVESSTKHEILYPSLAEAFRKIDNPMLQQIVYTLSLRADDQVLFDQCWHEIRTSKPLWLREIARFLQRKSVDLGESSPGRPDIHKRTESSKNGWIVVSCDVEKLDSAKPKVKVLSKNSVLAIKGPVEVDLYDVFHNFKVRV